MKFLVKFIASDNNGPFTLKSPWWTDGVTEDGEIEIRAALQAESVVDARDQIYSAYDIWPDEIVFTSAVEMPENWVPYSSNYGHSTWMEWN